MVVQIELGQDEQVVASQKGLFGDAPMGKGGERRVEVFADGRHPQRITDDKPSLIAPGDELRKT